MTVSRKRVCLGVVAGVSLSATPAAAHNRDVHQAIVETAYETMLLVDKAAAPPPNLPVEVVSVYTDLATDPAMAAFLANVRAALPKLRALPSGLPTPRRTTCVDPTLPDKLGVPFPDWRVSPFTTLAAIPAGSVRYPVALDYVTGEDCGILTDFSPGGIFEATNPGGFSSAEHTGTVLGMWAGMPEEEADDVRLYYRLTNMVGLSEAKSILEEGLGAAGASAWIPVKCILSCFGELFGLGGSCKKCLPDAIADAKTGSHDVISELDGWVPGTGDASRRETSLFSRQIDTAHPLGGPWAAPLVSFDDRRGFVLDRSGPFGLPDTMEVGWMMAADAVGISVHYDESKAPKNYQVLLDSDGHKASTERKTVDWEYLSYPHIPFTPLDNFAFHGWSEAEAHWGGGAFASTTPADPTQTLRALGFTLDALGDASVPHYVTTTTGWSRAPFEDAVSALLPEIMHRDDPAASLAWVKTRILPKALVFRAQILSWRAAHPGSPLDVPIRDLVSSLADKTWDKVKADGKSLFNPVLSTTYLADKDLATGPLLDAGWIDLYRTLLEESIAATVAVLAAATEVMP